MAPSDAVERAVGHHSRADTRPGEDHLPAPGRRAFCVAGVLRLLVGGVVSGVVAATYPQSANPLVGFLIGLGGLSAVQQATTLAPLMVKSAGRAAFGGVVEEAQSQAQALQQNGQHPGQPAGPVLGPQTGSPPAGNPQANTGVAAQQDPTGGGGVA